MDSAGASSSLDYTITIAAPVISVGPAILPPGIASVAYGVQFTASGGTPPYTFAVFDEQGAFPVASISSLGYLQFTTNVVGVAKFRVEATDAHFFKGSQEYQLTINPPPLSIKPDLLPSARFTKPTLPLSVRLEERRRIHSP